jgi:hypothetical protein
MHILSIQLCESLHMCIYSCEHQSDQDIECFWNPTRLLCFLTIDVLRVNHCSNLCHHSLILFIYLTWFVLGFFHLLFSLWDSSMLLSIAIFLVVEQTYVAWVYPNVSFLLLRIIGLFPIKLKHSCLLVEMSTHFYTQK